MNPQPAKPDDVKATNVRFPDDLFEYVKHQAKVRGVSMASYVREATLMRAAFEKGLEVEGSDRERFARAVDALELFNETGKLD